MDTISAYWYEKMNMPESAVTAIKAMVTGETVGVLNIDGHEVELLKVSGDVFGRVFLENRKYLYQGDYTAPSEENDYNESVNFVTEDGLAGFSVTKDGWLRSLYSNYQWKGFAYAIKEYILSYAYKLVFIQGDDDKSGGLQRLYETAFGFRAYVRTSDDTRILGEYYGTDFIENFVEHAGMPYHIFMIAADATGDNNPEGPFEDYFVAKKYVDDTVSIITKECGEN